MTGRPRNSESATFWSGVQASAKSGASVPGANGVARCSTAASVMTPVTLLPGRESGPSASDQSRPRPGRVDRGRERVDVVSAVVAPAVDEEGRRTGDSAEIGAVDVLGHTPRADALMQVVGEAFDVEPELFGVADQVVVVERVLMIEEKIVHLPE